MTTPEGSITFRIRKEDIEKGVPRDRSRCMVARRLSDLLPGFLIIADYEHIEAVSKAARYKANTPFNLYAKMLS